MNITFKNLLTTSGIFSIVMTTILVGIAFTTNQKMTTELNHVANTGSLLGTQMEADMMHDALRADVFSIELSLASYNFNDLKAAQTDIEEHSKIFNDAINSMLELNQDEKISASIAAVKPKLANYIAAANRVKELSATDEAPSKKIMNIQRVKVEFLKDFSALEVEMGNLSELIESKNAATKKSASQFATASSASLMTLGLIVIGVMFAGGLLILKRMRTLLGGDVETAAIVAEKIAQGEYAGDIQLIAGDETSLLAKMQVMSKTVKTLVNEINIMANEHERGDIDVKIDTQQFKGEFKLAADGINEMVQAHVQEKSQLVEVVDAFGLGNFKADLPSLPGKKANTNIAINKVRSNLISVIAAVNDVYQAHETGDIDQYLKTDTLKGDFVTLAESVNKLVESHIDLSRQALNVVKGFGEGNFDVPLPQFPGKKAYINQAIESTRSNIKTFVHDMQHMSAKHDSGDIDVRMDEEKFAGTYKEMAQGVNNMASGHIDMNKKAIAVVQAFGDGDFEMVLEKFPGKKAFINHAIEDVRTNLMALSKDSIMLSQAALDGRVLERADASHHKGDFRIIVEGINATLDTIVSPIKTVKEAVDMINSAANEISNGNTDLAQRTEEQAANFEKTAASMKVLGETVRKNADSAKEANSLAAEASGIAVKGGSVVGQVVSTMNAINESALKIEDIISVIDGIAFQTNILALNAAVEAARAGEQGRGFAVVAGEVRNLAQRSASAAKEIKDLISHSVERTAEGTKQVEVAGETMNKVVESVKRVSDFIREISSASSEQIIGIDLVNYALGQMNQDTQQNATMVEQAARAAESLLDQAHALATSVEVFKLNSENIYVSEHRNVDHHSDEIEFSLADDQVLEPLKTGTY